jgi:hypothetical protein
MTLPQNQTKKPVMKPVMTFLIACALILNSCGPKISTSISKSYPTLDYREEVRVFGLHEQIPNKSEVLGIVRSGDTGFSTDCGWDIVIARAKAEARKAGGNAIKITDHTPPSILGSSCHRITAKILRVPDFNDVPQGAQPDSSLINADYALLHVYRHSGMGSMVSFDLHLGDSVICRVSNKSKRTIKIKKDGLNTLWARTEAREEIPINIRFGREYYVRCSISMGAIVGHPKIELVDGQTGKAEFQSIKDK